MARARTVRRPEVDTDGVGLGWSARIMGVLRWAEHLVLAQVLIVVGTLAGGVVLGWHPSIDAAGRLLARLPAGTAPTAVGRDFWRAWRTGFRRANLVGAPLTVVAVLLVLDLAVVRVVNGPVRAALTAGLVVVGLCTVLAAAYLAPVLRRYDDGPVRVWRFLLLVPASTLPTSLALLVTLGVLATLFWFVPVLGALVGLSLPLLATGWIADLQLDRIDAR